MAIKNIAVFGIYPDQLTAEDAVDNLKDTGFRSTDISVLFPDNQGTKDFAHEKHTKAPEAAVAGGSSVPSLAELWDGLPASARLRFPELGPSLQPVPLWGCSVASESVER